MKHEELIARLGAAEVGSRELDAQICIALGYVGNNQGYSPRNVRVSDGDDEWLDYELGAVAYTAIIPDVSQSLDAALALAERLLGDLEWGIIKSNEDDTIDYHALIGPDSIDRARHALTPALALCIAILRALDRGEEK